MILVTGAAGKTGKPVVKALAGKGASVRALVRRTEHAAALKALGAAEVSIGSFEDRGALAARHGRSAGDLPHLPECQRDELPSPAPSPTRRRSKT